MLIPANMVLTCMDWIQKWHDMIAFLFIKYYLIDQTLFKYLNSSYWCKWNYKHEESSVKCMLVLGNIVSRCLTCMGYKGNIISYLLIQSIIFDRSDPIPFLKKSSYWYKYSYKHDSSVNVCLYLEIQYWAVSPAFIQSRRKKLCILVHYSLLARPDPFKDSKTTAIDVNTTMNMNLVWNAWLHLPVKMFLSCFTCMHWIWKWNSIAFLFTIFFDRPDFLKFEELHCCKYN